MAGAPSVQLTIHYGAADPQAMNDCLHNFGVTDVTDMLVRGPRALCMARVVGKTHRRSRQACGVPACGGCRR